MKLLFRSTVLPHEVQVHHVTESSITLVVIDSRVSVGFGNIIEEYQDPDVAVRAGEQFARYLKLAVDRGYHLSNKDLFHESGKRVHVSNLLDRGRSEESIINLLETGEFTSPL